MHEADGECATSVTAQSTARVEAKSRLLEAAVRFEMSCLSVDGNAELFPKDCLDSIHVVLHEGEFLLHVGHALEEFVEGGGEFIELLQPPFFKFLEAACPRPTIF
jgi:hypothetical protein